MKLSEYLFTNNLKQADFAHLIGESLQNINRWTRGTRRPTDAEVMLKIFQATDGQVTANDFFELPTPRKKNGYKQ